MGQYADTWNLLKQRGKIVLASPRPLHKRIIKAMKKKKYEDNVFKFQLSESNQRAVFTSTSEGNKITLYLRIESTHLNLANI